MTQAESRGQAQNVPPSLQEVAELLGVLRSELAAVQDEFGRQIGALQPLHDRIDALHETLAVQALPDLQPLDDQLQALRGSLDRLWAATADQTDQAGGQLRAEIEGLNERLWHRLDELWAAAADRTDQASLQLHADIEGLSEQLRRLGRQVSALSPPSLEPLDRVEDLRQQPLAIPTTDLQPVHDRLDALNQFLAAQPQSDLEPLEAQLQGLRSMIDELWAATLERVGRNDTEVRTDIQRLNEQLDGLRTALSDRFDAMGAPQQIVDALSPQLVALGELGRPDAVLAAIDTSSTSLRDHIAAITERLGDQSGALAPLETRLDVLVESEAAIREDLTLMMDVLAGFRQLTDSRPSLEPLPAMVAEQLRELLDATGVPELRSSVAGLAEQVLQARSADRALVDEFRAHAQRMTELAAANAAPVRAVIEELRTQIKALPAAADLSPVASQLARLSATVVSQARYEPVASEVVSELSQSINDSLQLVAHHIERQAAATAEVWAHLATQPSPAERADDLRHEVRRATSGLQAVVERLAVEVAATRKALERSAGLLEQTGSGNLEERVDLVLSAFDERLETVVEGVERAAARSDDAAKAARATVKALAPPTAAAGDAGSAPARAVKASTATRKAAPKAVGAKKVGAKKVGAKKVGAKKVGAKKAAGARKAPIRAKKASGPPDQLRS